MTSFPGLLTSVVIIAGIYLCNIAEPSEASKLFPDFSCYPLLNKDKVKQRNESCRRHIVVNSKMKDTMDSCLLASLGTYSEMTFGDDSKSYTWLPEDNAEFRKNNLIELIAKKGTKGATPEQLKEGEKAVDKILKNLEECRTIMEDEMRKVPKDKWAPILNCANKAFGCAK